MAGGQWEVVGGKTKKNKSKIPAKSQPQKKDEKTNGVSNFATAGPITESKTVFNAFLEKEKKETAAPKPQKTNESTKGKEKNASSHKKKGGDKKPASSKATLEDLFSEITEEDVKNHLATLEVLLPNSPLLWLKDLVQFFNVKLDISVDAATFTSKPSGYPCTLLRKGVYNLLLKTLNRCSSSTLQIFHEFCLNGLVQDGLKGLHVLGYCTILQCLAQEMPSIVTSNILKCSELCNAHSNRQNICLLLWWAAGQVGNKDLETGFQIWLQLMFPMMGEKNCSSYAIEYLEELVSKARKAEMKKNIIQVRDFFPILDFFHSKELPKNVQKRLMAVYPTLKVLSYGHDSENILRNYFPSYLRRLEPQCSPLLKSEILTSLVYCLEKDIRCFSVWRQLYTKHFIQSKLLIAHIHDEWETLPSHFPKRCLTDTLSVFQVTNEELMSNPKKNPDVQECSLINKELLLKLNASKYSWYRMILLFILFASLSLSYDIMTHNSFPESNVGKFMQDTGLLVVCAQAGEKLMFFYQKIQKFFETYSPAFVSWFHTTVVPYVELFLKELAHILSNMWNSTSSFRSWCCLQFPPLLELVEKQVPYVKENFLSLLRTISVQIVTYISFAWNSAESIALSLHSNEHIAFALESTRKYSSTALSSLQQYAVNLFQYAQSYVA